MEPIMIEKVVFNEETGEWHKQGTNYNGVTAATYPEAFEKLFGHGLPINPPTRSPRRRQEEEV